MREGGRSEGWWWGRDPGRAAGRAQVSGRGPRLVASAPPDRAPFGPGRCAAWAAWAAWRRGSRGRSVQISCSQGRRLTTSCPVSSSESDQRGSEGLRSGRAAVISGRAAWEWREERIGEGSAGETRARGRGFASARTLRSFPSRGLSRRGIPAAGAGPPPLRPAFLPSTARGPPGKSGDRPESSAGWRVACRGAKQLTRDYKRAGRRSRGEDSIAQMRQSTSRGEEERLKEAGRIAWADPSSPGDEDTSRTKSSGCEP
ncbi:hypothetical protein THAOC_26046 [Thalassiosira oceanica]|uniref:Uncharacterized protein n=1 Tax=Thalassiosira oceanica TaxID=159749 RepID=K0RZW7_THAOC|nr:hypothetical protein THAOC_26046 [Thalassiosira oceanica]|eukprot:EJK54336.1 hypothetical protein THAOC_26046 [Thalassiosira oceanica]